MLLARALHAGGTTLKHFFHIMRRQFTEKEWFQIISTPATMEKQQLCNFYRFWVHRTCCFRCFYGYVTNRVAVDSEGKFYQSRGQWTKLWPAEPGVHCLLELAT
jgi:hypothetical protein